MIIIAIPLLAMINYKSAITAVVNPLTMITKDGQYKISHYKPTINHIINLSYYSPYNKTDDDQTTINRDLSIIQPNHHTITIKIYESISKRTPINIINTSTNISKNHLLKHLLTI